MRLKQTIKISPGAQSHERESSELIGAASGEGFKARVFHPDASLRETVIDIMVQQGPDAPKSVVWSMQSLSDRPLYGLGLVMSKRTIGLVLALTAMGWIIFAAVVWVLVIKPLARLQSEISEIDEIRHETIQRLDRLSHKGVGEEVKQITEGLARMMQRVQKAETDRDAARVNMLHSNKMAALGEMAGGIAHEISNPLAVLRGLSHNLRKLLADESADKNKWHEILTLIDDTITRIVRIVKAMKVHSRTKIDLASRIGPAELLESSLTLCRDQLRDSVIELRFAFDENLPELACDEVQIGQVILNLVQNAIDAVAKLPPDDRWISVRISADAKRDRLRIIFSNGGPSIPEGVRARLFQPFFTTKPVGQGTGLGLSISASIVRSHYGRIDFDASKLNPTFVIDLPVERKSTEHVSSDVEAA